MKFTWIFFLLFYVPAMAQQASKIQPPEEVLNGDWVVLKRAGYSVIHPAGWRVDTSKAMGIDLYIFSNPDTAGDKFAENVNIMVSDLNGEVVTLDTFVRVSEKEIRTMATDFKFLESTRMNSNGQPYHHIEFTARSGIFELHFAQNYFIHKGKAYTITLTTEASKYKHFEAIGKRIFDFFQLPD